MNSMRPFDSSDLNTQFIFLFLLLLTGNGVGLSETPMIGAQIWIEPGQTPDQIDGWFRQLSEAHMPVARIFLMWTQIQQRRDGWDFTLYDCAFRSAEKYHVRIVATLTPSGPAPFLGGDGTQGNSVVGSSSDRGQAADYIARVVRVPNARGGSRSKQEMSCATVPHWTPGS